VVIRITGDAMMSAAALWPLPVSASTLRPTGTARGSSRLVPARPFTRDQAIGALTVAELGESGYSEGDPFVIACGEELQ
jgi:hypothetical protein